MLGALPVLLGSWLIKQLCKKKKIYSWLIKQLFLKKKKSLLYSCFCVLHLFLNLIVRHGQEVRFKLYQFYLSPHSCLLMKMKYTVRNRLPKNSKPCQFHLQNRFLIFTLVLLSFLCITASKHCYTSPTITLKNVEQIKSSSYQCSPQTSHRTYNKIQFPTMPLNSLESPTHGL